MLSIQVRRVESGSVELRILGEAGANYDVYHSSNLRNWKRFGTQEPGFWETVGHSGGLREEFYRVEPVGP